MNYIIFITSLTWIEIQYQLTPLLHRWRRIWCSYWFLLLSLGNSFSSLKKDVLGVQCRTIMIKMLRYKNMNSLCDESERAWLNENTLAMFYMMSFTITACILQTFLYSHTWCNKCDLLMMFVVVALNKTSRVENQNLNNK